MLAPGATWPLVGRAEELERIVRARADSGCSGLVLSAGAGVGKSRLAREASRVAAEDGALTDWVQATKSAAAVPLRSVRRGRARRRPVDGRTRP